MSPAPTGSLSALQERILALLAGLEPPFVLVGGAALSGFYFGHRSTRDLDLFWRGRPLLGELPEQVERRLTAEGLGVVTLQTAPQFHRFSVQLAPDICVLDLVAEPAPSSDPPIRVAIGGSTIWVDSLEALLAQKLCALLGRSEPRDLDDVSRLLEAGTRLEAALARAPAIDGGFSPLTLAWSLERWPLRSVAAAAGYDGTAAERLEQVRRELIARLTGAAPEAPPES